MAVNCSAFPKDLLESEWSGYREGAFAGALANKKGLMEEASGGTLFPGEIGELALEPQAKLLRVLETRSFAQIGDTKPVSVNGRIVAATNRNRLQEADAGHFQPDLYYRLAVFTVPVPPLNVRREDIEPLPGYFLHLYAAKLRKRLRGLAAASCATSPTTTGAATCGS
ncbi:hypothetical protein GCM10022408_37390 [Hymenobacter fastidiosus]|uniref:Sigma-54 factor interaction domain-containing protein n=1 Tax=Hymenobacter fastidiosus TaxID=486264 RepID=A0ABP7T1P0_9BACT